MGLGFILPQFCFCGYSVITGIRNFCCSGEVVRMVGHIKSTEGINIEGWGIFSLYNKANGIYCLLGMGRYKSAP